MSVPTIDARLRMTAELLRRDYKHATAELLDEAAREIERLKQDWKDSNESWMRARKRDAEILNSTTQLSDRRARQIETLQRHLRATQAAHSRDRIALLTAEDRLLALQRRLEHAQLENKKQATEAAEMVAPDNTTGGGAGSCA